MEQQKSVELLFWSLSHVHFVHVCRLPLKTIKEQENRFDFLVILLFSLTLPEAYNQPLNWWAEEEEKWLKERKE